MQSEYDHANMKCRLRKFTLIPLLLLYFIYFREKIDFTVKILILHIVSMGLKCMQMYAEAYLEPSRLSTM